ncbi:alanine--tRNA ligase [Rarobacter faecitabidus]|uniref:Alanine--tRNA ligase n=1 Tax=Rarobacter faecitabidus TaxID=13243 RepID=A0A542ZVY7_RARFA|nr:alanine--tRNA ligase [Rarobacter faecitabidus]TQL64472.1 alanyl-tRNA synthetase [Rarobacter faecitabidus]
MRTSEIRQRWLDYFERNGHHLAESASLISPDPSLLFTVAGMVPFIPYIIGTEKSPYPRIASVQKCIRTNDIDNVGRTTRHGTFFQMNGNFSFGDYFKEGAIDLAWGLLTASPDSGGYGFDPDRFWVTLWDQDTESFDVLTKKIGVDARKIVRLPREENFWDTGQPGPAGPCAEFHYDRGPEFGPEAVGGDVDPGGDRYLEIWNLVFDQFMRGEGKGKSYPLLHELEQKAIDTGAGLERMAFLLQGKNNMYEIDEVYPVIAATEQITGRTYGQGGEPDVQMRVIADHVRSSLMLIGDGVTPANEGRGYVLRRILRRAVRSLRLLGVQEASLQHLLPVSKDAMEASYPYLGQDFARISEVVYGEEESFLRTLASGTTILDVAVADAKKTAPSHPRLPGDAAFKLHDTYGFPIDLTLEMAREQGVEVDESAFRTLMAEQKARARADALAKKTGHTDTAAYEQVRSSLGASIEFLGYTQDEASATILGVLVDGKPVPAVTGPADVEVVLDRTPFYAEAGGQLADQGTITTDSGAVIDVFDVQTAVPGLRVHRGQLGAGTLAVGDPATASIDTTRRGAISRAHTGTHLIHKALQETLGKDKTQAGSEDAPNRIRFDFKAQGAPTASALQEIEGRVNERLRDNLSVTDKVMDLDAAKALGAMALFGEKYGDRVRVVSIGDDWSRELCAGTHVKQSGELGLVTLVGEASIGSGVRRVEALVGSDAKGFHAREHAIVGQLSGLLGARSEELPDRISSLLAKLKDSEKQLAALRQAQLLGSVATIAAGATRIGDVSVVAYDAGDVAGGDDLRTLALEVRSRLGESAALVVIGGVSKGRPIVVAATNAAAREAGIKAGAAIASVAGALGGRGGGKDDVAQGGGTDPSLLAPALGGVESFASHHGA